MTKLNPRTGLSTALPWTARTKDEKAFVRRQVKRGTLKIVSRQHETYTRLGRLISYETWDIEPAEVQQ